MGFSIINHPFWGIPIYGTPHIYLLQSRIFDDIFMKSGFAQQASMLSTSCPSIVREATSRANDTVGAKTYCPPLRGSGCLAGSGTATSKAWKLLGSQGPLGIAMKNGGFICLTTMGDPWKWWVSSPKLTIAAANIQPAEILLSTRQWWFDQHIMTHPMRIFSANAGVDKWKCSICSKKVGGALPAQIEDLNQHVDFSDLSLCPLMSNVKRDGIYKRERA